MEERYIYSEKVRNRIATIEFFYCAIKANLLGGAIGAVLSVVLFLLPLSLDAAFHTPPSDWLFIGAVAFVIWIAGLFMMGTPVWFCLHILGYRKRRHAVIAGAALSGIAAYFIFKQSVLDYMTLGMPVIGGLIGALIWRQLYGRAV